MNEQLIEQRLSLRDQLSNKRKRNIEYNGTKISRLNAEQTISDIEAEIWKNILIDKVLHPRKYDHVANVPGLCEAANQLHRQNWNELTKLQQRAIISVLVYGQQPVSFEVEIKPLYTTGDPIKAKVIPVISLDEVIRYKVKGGSKVAVMHPHELSHLIESKQYKIL